MKCETKHERPAHLNCGRNGSAWICFACGKQLSGKPLKISDTDKKLLADFIDHATALPGKRKEETNMNLEIKVLAGAESKQFLVDLTKQIDRLEKALGGTATTSAEPKAAETKSAKSAKTAKPAKLEAIEEEEEVTEAGSDDPAEFSDEEESFEDEAEEETAKTVTKEDALKALQAYSKKHSRDKAMTVLKKYAKTGAVKDVPPAKYGDLVNALKV